MLRVSPPLTPFQVEGQLFQPRQELARAIVRRRVMFLEVPKEQSCLEGQGEMPALSSDSSPEITPQPQIDPEIAEALTHFRGVYERAGEDQGPENGGETAQTPFCFPL